VLTCTVSCTHVRCRPRERVGLVCGCLRMRECTESSAVVCARSCFIGFEAARAVPRAASLTFSRPRFKLRFRRTTTRGCALRLPVFFAIYSHPTCLANLVPPDGVVCPPFFSSPSHRLAQMLRKLKIFGPSPPDEFLAEVGLVLQPSVFSPGELIYTAGHIADSLFVLRAGAVSLLFAFFFAPRAHQRCAPIVYTEPRTPGTLFGAVDFHIVGGNGDGDGGGGGEGGGGACAIPGEGGDERQLLRVIGEYHRRSHSAFAASGSFVEVFGVSYADLRVLLRWFPSVIPPIKSWVVRARRAASAQLARPLPHPPGKQARTHGSVGADARGFWLNYCAFASVRGRDGTDGKEEH
jgi:hypothetical protein